MSEKCACKKKSISLDEVIEEIKNSSDKLGESYYAVDDELLREILSNYFCN